MSSMRAPRLRAALRLAGGVELALDLFIRDLDRELDRLKALVLAERDLGVQGDGEGEADRACVGDLDILNGRGADDVQRGLLQAELIGLGSQLVHRVLIEDLMAVHALDHGAGRLALAEAGDAYRRSALAVGVVDGLLKLGRVGLDGKSSGIFLFLFYVL